MGNGFALAGAAGAGGDELQKVLAQRFLEQLQRAKLDEEMRQANMSNQIQQGQLGLGQQRIGLDREEMTQRGKQFDTTAGFKGREVGMEEAMQPVRIAHTQAQTADITRRPQAEADDRRHDFEVAGLRGGQELQQIAASGQEQRKTENVRIAGAREKAAAGTDKQASYGDERTTRIVNSVDELDKKVSRWTTGAGSLLSSMPATDARDFAAELNSLKANVAFGELAEMRAASKTGGALGAVSEKEMTLLESALGALDQGQSSANFKGQLKKVKDSLARWDAAKHGQTTTANVGGGQTQGPQRGERRTISGQLAEWDGKGWKAVKP